MKAVRLVVLLVVGSILLGLVPASAETTVYAGPPAYAVVTRDYPISVSLVDDPAKAVKKDVVVVHFLGSDNAPLTATLNEFMQEIVPSWALNTGNLPQAANVATLVENVTVPGLGKAFIVDDRTPATPNGFTRKDKRPRLPVYLRVKIRNLDDRQIGEDRNERFRGIVADPWTIESYFITRYTVIARVTKQHRSIPYPHVAKRIVDGSYHKFNWVDP